ncbi:MAG: glycosyltransferase [Acidobacteria bacterium]|nr:glycosyltransferase [Acidobacteriota bacterium]
MRYLHVVESLRRGGMETTFLAMLRIFRELEAVGSAAHDVLAFSDGPLRFDYLASASHLFIASTGEELRGVLDRRYELVNLLFDRCAHRLAPMLLARGDSAIFYSKGYDIAAMYRMEGGFEWRAEDALLCACDGISFTTPELARHYAQSPLRKTFLEKAVEFERFSCVPPVSARTPNRVLCIANLHPRKHVVDLVTVLRLLLHHVPNVELRVVGEGERDWIQSEAEAAGVAGRFVMAGRSDDVPREIADCRVVVLPSQCEGVPTALLEAMAAGRPVVCAQVGHIETILTDGREGFFVSHGDIASFADRLRTILIDPELASRMGDAGRATAAAHDVRGIAARYLESLRATAVRWRSEES